MTTFIYFSALLMGYGVLAILILTSVVILYAVADEIVRYLIDKPRKKRY
jgi:hypothetical protein